MRSGRDTCESRPAPTERHLDGAVSWQDVVSRFAPYVAAVADAYQFPESEAEDLFQDVFTHTWTRMGTFSDDELMRDWIVSLTHMLALRRQPSRQATAEPTPALLEGLHRALVASETIRLLPTGQREVAQLHAAGADVDEIASALGMEPSLVSDHIRRTRRRVRARLATVRRSGGSNAFED
jgi:RNA polymerase sigma factor (sigma-70 family)